MTVFSSCKFSRYVYCRTHEASDEDRSASTRIIRIVSKTYLYQTLLQRLRPFLVPTTLHPLRIQLHFFPFPLSHSFRPLLSPSKGDHLDTWHFPARANRNLTIGQGLQPRRRAERSTRFQEKRNVVAERLIPCLEFDVRSVSCLGKCWLRDHRCCGRERLS